MERKLIEVGIMTDSQIYILVVIIALAIIAILFLLFGKNKPRKLTPLAAIAFGCVIAGLFASDNRILGYSLISAGIILSVIDTIRKGKR